MVSVHVSFQQPVHLQLLFPHIGDKAVSVLVGRSSSSGIIIEYRVNDGATLAHRVGHDVAVCKGDWIEKRFYVRLHDYAPIRYPVGYFWPQYSFFGSMLRIKKNMRGGGCTSSP